MKDSKKVFTLIKLIIFLSLAIYLSFWGQNTFDMPIAVLRILTGLLYLFAFLRGFEWYQMHYSENK